MRTEIFKSLCLLVGLAFLIQSNAQAQDGTSFGIRAGVNFQNITGQDAAGTDVENDIVTRFHAGVQADIPIAPTFYFQPGLLFSTKGAKRNIRVLQNTVSVDVNTSYIELPLHFLFKPALGNGNMILGIGPYLAYGIGGKAKFDGGNEQDVKFDKSVTLLESGDAVYFRPFDAGGNLIVGYQFGNGLLFQLNAQLGLLNISPEYSDFPEDESDLKNTGFGLSVGYGF